MKRLLAAAVATACLVGGATAVSADTSDLTVELDPDRGPAGTTIELTSDVAGTDECVAAADQIALRMLEGLVTDLMTGEFSDAVEPELSVVSTVLFVGLGLNSAPYKDLQDLAFSLMHDVSLVDAGGNVVGSGTIDPATGDGTVTVPEGTAPGMYQVRVTCMDFVSADSAAADAALQYVRDELAAAGNPVIEDPLSNDESRAFIESVGTTLYLKLIEPGAVGVADFCLPNSSGECAAEPAPPGDGSNPADDGTIPAVDGAIPAAEVGTTVAVPAQAVKATPAFTG